ncbi:(d)CMP kinase [Spiroplasma alleghenense]|uniref:Cytidylate kinase n=1 Tax=Spiroplasma alleghenense TaxID=216931 RepID=A0A345Z491_9MOLU|nr:(d)CMP kinase [Spiroplasma alleghenense]AXK51420.1 cytidylate kinase [Spiroplasma alleghenense]
MKKINIAVDGPAGSGKSATMKIVAEKLNYHFFDTGLMYRAYTWFCNQKKLDFNNDKLLVNSLKDFDFKINQDQVLVNGVDVSKELSSNDIIKNINKITVNPEIRRWMVQEQRNLSQGKGFVVVGRDIGSVVLKDAELKIYLDCSVESRAMRRFKQNEEQKITPNILEDIRQAIENRDKSDMQRSEGPLIKTDDAILIDNSDLTINEAVELILKEVSKKIN